MRTLKIEKDAVVKYNSKICTITHILSLKTVILRDNETGESIRATISELSEIDLSEEPVQTDNKELLTLSDEEWALAESRYAIIEPLLKDVTKRNLQSVQEIAKKNKISPATLYRWLGSYEDTGLKSSLLRRKRSDKGKSRLSPESESMIEEVIESYYLTKNKRKISQAYNHLKVMAKRAGIKAPSPATFQRRISELATQKTVEYRISKAERRAKFSHVGEGYKEADHPLSVVQIDHTPVDLMLVDEEERISIGRAWVTVAICVFSRMVCGYYLTLERPSCTSVALCLEHAILSKDKWLAERDIDAEWPVWGVMDNLHADNAPEFRSKALNRAASNYNISINWRPLGRADFGGHIERLLGTFNKDIHEIEGTTFSNIKERGRYKSEELAIFTLNEFDKWLATYISKVYHQSPHSGIDGMTPIAKFNEGMLGGDDGFGSGIPEVILDEERLRMDFLPVYERSVQRYGIEIDGLFYYHPLLAKWIKQKNPHSADTHGKYIVKRDPRDISRVYFYDPDLNDYLEIPCRNRAMVSMTLWELKELKKSIKEKGKKTVDEDAILAAREELQIMEESAKQKTKKQRRMNERKRIAKKQIKKSKEKVENAKADVELDIFNVEVDEFEEIQG
ncbi:MAG: transposase [Rickettsiales bacterium]|nr:transposase [Rickettsiales bacterium]